MQTAASLLKSCIDKNMDRWELFCLQHIFHVPRNVEMPMYQGINWDITEEDDKALDERIENARRRLFNARQTRRLITSNMQKVKQQLRLMQQFVRKFECIPEIASKHSITSLSNSAGTIASQFQEMVKASDEASKYESRLGQLNSLSQRKKFRGNSDLIDVGDAVKEEEMYESLMKRASLENIECFANTNN